MATELPYYQLFENVHLHAWLPESIAYIVGINVCATFGWSQGDRLHVFIYSKHIIADFLNFDLKFLVVSHGDCNSSWVIFGGDLLKCVL